MRRKRRKWKTGSKYKCSLEVEKYRSSLWFQKEVCWRLQHREGRYSQKTLSSDGDSGSKTSAWVLTSPFRFGFCWRSLGKCISLGFSGQSPAGQRDGSVHHQPLPGGTAASRWQTDWRHRPFTCHIAGQANWQVRYEPRAPTLCLQTEIMPNLGLVFKSSLQKYSINWINASLLLLREVG